MRREIESYLEGFASEGDTAEAGIAFDEGFSGFKGHFPEQPILPGVCQIALAMVMAERMRGTRQVLTEVVNAKFVSMVRPGQRLQVECALADGLLRAKLHSGETRVAEFKLRVEDA
jgi:3-hydroxymyristoyl/3-hydroxydecanoyl-(acyl carrier protein) dehydratase